MSCCCTNTLKYCNQNICGEGIDFNVTAQMPGVFKMITSFLNTQIVVEKEFLLDEEIVFPLTDFNENYEYTATLYDPNFEKVIIQKDGINYDCFKFKTVIQKTLVFASEES